MVEDTDRRLEELFERLGNKDVPGPVLTPLSALAKGKAFSFYGELCHLPTARAYVISFDPALNAKDIRTASDNAMQLNLLATSHSNETRWIVGIKRLVELYGRVLSQGGQ
jgi:hypothetical protein